MIKQILLSFIILASLHAQGKKDYMLIEKEDWILGAIKLDINFSNGAFDHTFGIFLDDNTILTSSLVDKTGYPNDINIKIKDKNANLITCIAKANLIVSDDDYSLALLKIKHYTDDYCNYSPKRFYHYELIHNQIINLNNPNKLVIIDKLDSKSPFLINNYKKTINIENGFPYFDMQGNLIGISSGNKIIKKENIKQFLKFAKNQGID